MHVQIIDILTLYDHLQNNLNLHFEDEYDIHMSSKNKEESGYNHNLDLLTT